LIQSFAAEFDRLWNLAVLPVPVEATAVPPSDTVTNRPLQGPN